MSEVTQKLKEQIYYVYIFLDPRKPGEWRYKDYIFQFQPFYVGKGKADRINEHFWPSNLEKSSHKNHTIKGIRNDNLQPIRIKLVENSKECDALSLEMELISHFGRKNIKAGILTNLTNGGEGVSGVTFSEDRKAKMSKILRGKNSPSSKSVIQKDMEGNIIKIWESIEWAGKELGISVTSISLTCRGKKESFKGFLWEFNGTLHQPKPKSLGYKIVKIFKYSLGGNFIKEYESQIMALKELGEDSGGFSQCLDTDSSRQRYGFLWFSSFQGEKVKPYISRSKSVRCFDLLTDSFADFVCAMDASIATGISSITICSNCSKPYLVKKRFKFQYIPQIFSKN